MSRFHTVFDADTQTQMDIPFTAEEEAERDEQEVQAEIDVAIWLEQEERAAILNSKLADDSITFEEMKELMRLRG